MTSAISGEYEHRYQMLRHGTKGRTSSFRRGRAPGVCRLSREGDTVVVSAVVGRETHSISGRTISRESRPQRRLLSTIARTDRYQRAVLPKNNARRPTDKRGFCEASIVVAGRISNCRCGDCTRRLFAQSARSPICLFVFRRLHTHTSISCPRSTTEGRTVRRYRHTHTHKDDTRRVLY